MKTRRKILIVVGVVFAVAILIPVIRHYQLRFAVESYVAELKAKGEPMELAQVIPPPVPPEQNGALLITNAFADLKPESIATSNSPPAMRLAAPGRAIIGWQQQNIINFDATNSWEDLGQELVAVRKDLNGFQNLTSHPSLDFHVDHKKGLDLLLPYLAPLKRSAQWLSASALFNLHQGNPKKAFADVHAMHALVRGETDDRTIISQLVRIAIASMSANVTWEMLQDPNVSDDNLALLQQDWQSLDFIHFLEQSFVYERAEHLPEYEQIRKSSDRFNKLWGYFYTCDTPSDESFFPTKQRSLSLRKWDAFRWRWFWSYQDELHSLQSYRVLIDATRMVETNESLNSVESFSAAGLKSFQDSSEGLRSFSTFASDSSLRKAVRIKTAQNIVITAIALKRHELRYHQLPATLDELTPELIKSVPIDCIDGQPLRYRRNADGTFLLYSVGKNGVDDGGDPFLEKGITSFYFYWQNDHALDWVWPQPATAAEIQKYYEELAKKAAN